MTDAADIDIEAAREFARRWLKGLPDDRLCDGAIGAGRVARGILRLALIIEEYEGIERTRGEDAMRLHHADQKQARQTQGERP